MSIETLRAKALAHNASLRFTYPMCLDPEHRAKIDKAASKLSDLNEQRRLLETAEDLPARRKLTDAPPTLKIDKQLAEIEAELELLEAEIPDDALLLVHFKRLSPTQYQDLQSSHLTQEPGKDAKLDVASWWIALAEATYLETTDRSGENLNLTWDDVRENTLSSMDLEYCYAGIVELHRRVTRVPFKTSTSGAPATS